MLPCLSSLSGPPGGEKVAQPEWGCKKPSKPSKKGAKLRTGPAPGGGCVALGNFALTDGRRASPVQAPGVPAPGLGIPGQRAGQLARGDRARGADLRPDRQ